MTERDLLADCLRRLNRLGLPYMLTGSVVYGPERAAEIVAAFDGDFHIEEASVRGAFSKPYMFNAIDRRSALKVVFWTLRPDPFEQEMFERRFQVTLFGEPAWIATAEDTLLHKLYWNRISPSERQLGDAAGIVAVQGDDLDHDHLKRVARDLDEGGDVSRTPVLGTFSKPRFWGQL